MTNSTGDGIIVIIGAGLVGGATLREIVLEWAHPNSDRPQKRRLYTNLNTSVVDRIYVTAISISELAYQLSKTEKVVDLVGDLSSEFKDETTLVISHGERTLTITGEVLDIVPIGLSPGNVNDQEYRQRSTLYSYLVDRKPQTLIVGANLSAIVAYSAKDEEVKTLALSWVLHTLKQVAVESEIETIAIIGTTALGGQGANLVWTHQSSQEMDSGLVSKIFAAYGILGVLDRVNWEVDLQTRWILLTPGSLLGYDYVSSGIVNYFSIPGNLPDAVQATVQENHGKVPLYKPIEICLASLSDEKVDWATRKLQDSFLSGVRIKCGETGDLSPLQFACISHASQMGFNTDSYVAKVLVTELMGRNTGYNQIPLGSGKILEPTAQGHDEREFALQRTAQLELETKRRSPSVYPALGSPRTQKEIVLADLVYRLLTEKYGDPTIQQLCDYDSVLLSDDLWKLLENDSLLLAEVTAVIPVITPTGKLYTGPSIMYLERSITRSLDLFSLTNEDQLQQFAALGAVDLRPHQFDIEHRSKTYKTGTGVLINRARYIVKNYLNALQPHTIDNCGSGIDSRIRSWSALTKDGCTTFDPVRFTVHFLGGERPFIW